MELIFAWIYESANKVVYRQGFNFSPQYNFYVKDCGENVFVLENDQTWYGNLNIFKKNSIENISVIIGKNGCGKTEMLNHLFTLRDVDLRVFKDEDDIIIEMNERESPLYVMECGSSLPEGYTVKKISELQHHSVYNWNEINTFYFTNSTHTREPALYHENPVYNEWYLSPNKINEIGKEFYQEVFRGYSRYSKSLFGDWVRYFRERYSINSISPICDALLYSWILKEQRQDAYPSKISDRIRIHIPRFKDWVGEYVSDKTSAVAIRRLPVLIGAIKDTKLYETCCQREKEGDISQITTKLLLLCLTECFLQERNDTVAYYLTHSLDDYYYWKLTQKKKNDYETEIEAIDRILQRVEIYQASSTATYSIFELSWNNELFWKIMDLFERKQLFFFRYVQFSFSELSSGEKAFNNMFSWPLFISHYQRGSF